MSERARAEPGSGNGINSPDSFELIPGLPDGLPDGDDVTRSPQASGAGAPVDPSDRGDAWLVLGPDGLADVPGPPLPPDAEAVDTGQAREPRTGSGNGNGNGNGRPLTEQAEGREYYLRSAHARDAIAGDEGNGESKSNGPLNAESQDRAPGATRINPFGGPGKVDPTLQFVQGAIRARPALTEEIVTAALKLSPEQAHRIVLAAIRANPRAKSSILRIARNAGASGFRLAVSLIVALFLYELFGQQNVADAHENEEAYARRLAIPESFLAWFTSAAATMAILFDDDAVGRLKGALRLSAEDDVLSFQDILEQVADLDVTAAAQLGDNLYGDAEPPDPAAATAESQSGGGFSEYRLESLGDGLDATGALGGEAVGRDGGPRGGRGRFSDPDLAPFMFDGLTVPDPLGDEETENDGPPASPEEDTDDPADSPDGPPDEDADGGDGGQVAVTDTAGEESDTVVTFTVLRQGPSDGTATVDFATVAGTAEEGADFVATSGTLTFAPGVTALTVSVDLVEDFLFESTEQFGLRLSNPDNAVIDAGEAQATLADSDGARIVWSLEGDQRVEEGQQASYTLSRNGADIGPGQTVSIDLTINLPGGPGGAEAQDFQKTLAESLRRAIDALGPDSGVTLSGNRLIFAEGAPAQLTFTLDPAADGVAEGVENFTLLLNAPSVGRIAPDGALVTTAIGDGDAGEIRWQITGEPLVTEGEAAPFSIAYSGPALAPDETASIRVGVDLPGGSGGAKAADFETSVLAAIANAIDALGPDPGVRLDGNLMTFEPGGPTSLDFLLQTRADSLLERAEGFTLTLTEPSFGEVPAGQGSATTIIDDTSTQNLRWSITGDLLAREGGSPRYTVGFAGVTLAEGVVAAIDLVVNLPGGVGGAEAADFTRQFYEEVDRAIAALGPNPGVSRDGSTLVFTEGAPTNLTFELTTLDDGLFEDTENYTVLISNPSEGEIEAGRNLVTTAILDDEQSAPIVGTEAADNLDGTTHDDRIDGLAGDDIIQGSAGDDIIDAGAGDDTVFGGPGHDTILGADGDDVLIGGGGNDTIEGGAGMDRLDGGRGNDVLIGGPGADQAVGGPGADMFVVSVIDVEPGTADEVADFTPGDGDSIHVLDLIGGLQGPMVDVDEFIRLQETDSGDTIVQTDSDGSGGPAQFVDTLVLQNSTGLDLEQMLNDGALVVD